MKIGIIGYGQVGQATHELFPDAQIYDKFIPEFQKPLNAAIDIAFLAVPTPWNGNELDCSAVEDAISEVTCDFFVIRSATYPGFADEMSRKYSIKIVVQPEHMGETPNHPMSVFSDRQFMILGGEPKDRRKVIECYSSVYNSNITIRQMSAKEAEFVKLSENRAIFWKVMQCQELYDACEAAGIDYYSVREAVYGDDPRLDLWFSFVYPDNRGANSKCIPKDVYAWNHFCESNGLDAFATKQLLEYNQTLVSNKDEY
jgi:UDP-glucose 6-dehydrogenase